MVFHIFRWFFQGLASAISRSQGDDHRGTVQMMDRRTTVTSSGFLGPRRKDPRVVLRGGDKEVPWCAMQMMQIEKVRKAPEKTGESKRWKFDWCLFQNMDSYKYIQISSITLNASAIKNQTHLKLKASNETPWSDENDIRNASRRPVTLLGATAIDDKLQDEVPETIEQQLEAVSIALRICLMMWDDSFCWWFLHFVYFQVFQISCIFMFPQIYLGSMCFYVFLIHILFRWHAATKAPTGRNTCCSEASTVSCEGRSSQIQLGNLEIRVRFCTFFPACNLSGLRFGCSLVTRSTQPSVLPCRASCSRKRWTISSLTATRSRGHWAIPKNPKGKIQEEYRRYKYRPNWW